MRYFKTILFAIMVASFGAAHGAPTITPTISATPNLGVVVGATVRFYRNDGTTLLRQGTTGPGGLIQVNVGSYRGVVVVEVRGNNNARYYDEAAGTQKPFRAPNRMWALVPRPGLTIAVTPLTTLAYDQARAERLFPLSGCEVFELNEIIQSSLLPGVNNILFVPTRFSSSTTRNSLNNTQAGRYAAVLAALARLGEDKGAPAVAVLNFLRRDARDGIIDGRINGRAFVSRPPLYTNLISELRPLIRDVVADFGSPGLRRVVEQLFPNDRNIDSGSVRAECAPPPPPPTGGTGGTGGTGSGGGGI